ncbi:iron-sulfur cluster-binding protein [Striga asiatica]|uniref:Iron-sulfur cluster-binding protein n=1 Tax=Striga asiatica TaxID=4170 RepID=A0A5A7QA75_STRAF|nr:iron-sulfur cluster-binding protein [Striga asiatica]
MVPLHIHRTIITIVSSKYNAVKVPPAAAASTAVAQLRHDADRALVLLEHDARQILHPEGLQQIYGLLVNLDVVDFDGGLLRHEVHAALALLLLQLEGDAPDGPLLDPLHEVGRETGDLVAEALRGDDGDLLEDLLVGVEIKGHLRVVPLDDQAGGLLHGLSADAAHFRRWLRLTAGGIKGKRGGGFCC